MKWVKASERKPDKEQLYWCKIGDGRYPLDFFNGGFHFVISGSWKPDEYIEWLDESEATEPAEKNFQWKVYDWCIACFGEEITHDVAERNHRFLEEALELVQATGATKSECLQLVDYVFNRDIGEVNQELGGVMVTLAALTNAIGLQMSYAGETELTRVWQKIEKIRAKQAAKPKHSPLPEVTTTAIQQGDLYRFIKWDGKDENTWPKQDGTVVFRNQGEFGLGYYQKEPPQGEEQFFDEGDEWLCKVASPPTAGEQNEIWEDLIKYLNFYNSQNNSGQMYFPVLDLKSKYLLIKK